MAVPRLWRHIVALLCAWPLHAGAAPNLRRLSSKFESPEYDSDLIFVASAEQVRFAIHVFDLTLYVNRASKLWGAKHTVEEVAAAGPGDISLRYDIVSPLVTPERFGPGLENALKPALSSAAWEELSGHFSEKVPKGTWQGADAVIYLDLDVDGVRLRVNGKDLGKVSCSEFSRALLHNYLTEPSNAAFASEILKRLESPAPSPGSTVHGHLIHSGAFVMNYKLLVGGLVLLVLAALLACVCCRRRRRRRRKEREEAVKMEEESSSGEGSDPLE
eukprot:TRINITY_DN30362_c0_g4_i1.p1 TRINITY_DN30362_c0_g4~~TRINITY_DN30362_c0_g4_i1.p1  ORF type:complete len:284 (-),score=52.54 TRINITY_DN30362_c0_g4_i1:114-935(-)